MPKGKMDRTPDPLTDVSDWGEWFAVEGEWVTDMSDTPGTLGAANKARVKAQFTYDEACLDLEFQGGDQSMLALAFAESNLEDSHAAMSEFLSRPDTDDEGECV